MADAPFHAQGRPSRPEESQNRMIARRLAPRRGDLAVFAGGVLLPLGIFVALGVIVAGHGAPGWDTRLLDLSERHYQGPIYARVDAALEGGRLLAAVILLGAVILLLTRRRGREALFCLLAVGGVVALDIPLKELFGRPEWLPPGSEGGNATEYVFPSGHAMGSVAVLAALTLISKPRWSRAIIAVGLPLVVAVGVVLVYAWWHYPSDVVGGWCFALAWVTALWLVLRPRPGPVR
jgi:membrane-associated phospholipid phosphatase